MKLKQKQDTVSALNYQLLARYGKDTTLHVFALVSRMMFELASPLQGIGF